MHAVFRTGGRDVREASDPADGVRDLPPGGRAPRTPKDEPRLEVGVPKDFGLGLMSMYGDIGLETTLLGSMAPKEMFSSESLELLCSGVSGSPCSKVAGVASLPCALSEDTLNDVVLEADIVKQT